MALGIFGGGKSTFFEHSDMPTGIMEQQMRVPRQVRKQQGRILSAIHIAGTGDSDDRFCVQQ